MDQYDQHIVYFKVQYQSGLYVVYLSRFSTPVDFECMVLLTRMHTELHILCHLNLKCVCDFWVMWFQCQKCKPEGEHEHLDFYHLTQAILFK